MHSKIKKNSSEMKKQIKIKVKNFGPISEGAISLKPLTIFTGPNNAGKSFLATLIYSINKSLHKLRGPSMIKPSDSDFDDFINDNIEYKNIIEKISKKDIAIDLDLELIKSINKKVYDQLLIGIESEIVNSFATPIDDLVKIGKRNFNLEIQFDKFDLSIKSSKNRLVFNSLPTICPKKVHIKSYFGEDFTVSDMEREFIKFFLSSNNIELRKLVSQMFNLKETDIQDLTYHGPNGCITVFLGEDVYILIDINRLKIAEIHPIEEINEIIFSSIYDYTRRKIFQSFQNQCFYLPAARSGILQSHKAIVASIIRKVPSVVLKGGFDIPKLSGVISEFISTIIELSGKARYLDKLDIRIRGSDDFRKKFISDDLIKNFQNEIISGEIKLHHSDSLYKYPEIWYHYKETEIPLHRSSSTVSELAPLFLYLKHLIEKSDTLIIEEPEAHLHPANQIILGKYLVRLIREGINIFITTHSEWLIEQLNNFLIFGKISEEKRKKFGDYTANDYLLDSEVSAYIFNYNAKKDGFIIEELQIEKNGISEESFLKIDEVLYKETFRLRKLLNDQ
ncbi:MAG: AAA family ATPase [Promethearchaeota archaeon]